MLALRAAVRREKFYGADPPWLAGVRCPCVARPGLRAGRTRLRRGGAAVMIGVAVR